MRIDDRAISPNPPSGSRAFDGRMFVTPTHERSTTSKSAPVLRSYMPGTNHPVTADNEWKMLTIINLNDTSSVNVTST